MMEAAHAPPPVRVPILDVLGTDELRLVVEALLDPASRPQRGHAVHQLRCCARAFRNLITNDDVTRHVIKLNPRSPVPRLPRAGFSGSAVPASTRQRHANSKGRGPAAAGLRGPAAAAQGGDALEPARGALRARGDAARSCGSNPLRPFFASCATSTRSSCSTGARAGTPRLCCSWTGAGCCPRFSPSGDAESTRLHPPRPRPAGHLQLATRRRAPPPQARDPDTPPRVARDSRAQPQLLVPQPFQRLVRDGVAEGVSPTT